MKLACVPSTPSNSFYYKYIVQKKNRNFQGSDKSSGHSRSTSDTINTPLITAQEVQTCVQIQPLGMISHKFDPKPLQPHKQSSDPVTMEVHDKAKGKEKGSDEEGEDDDGVRGDMGIYEEELMEREKEKAERWEEERKDVEFKERFFEAARVLDPKGGWMFGRLLGQRAGLITLWN
ncbi:hypothetical protein MMC21_005473 [Puttea exsequens]|nr:hypothetical protein [Puttea exsequens]